MVNALIKANKRFDFVFARPPDMHTGGAYAGIFLYQLADYYSK